MAAHPSLLPLGRHQMRWQRAGTIPIKQRTALHHPCCALCNPSIHAVVCGTVSENAHPPRSPGDTSSLPCVRVALSRQHPGLAHQPAKQCSHSPPTQAPRGAQHQSPTGHCNRRQRALQPGQGCQGGAEGTTTAHIHAYAYACCISTHHRCVVMYSTNLGGRRDCGLVCRGPRGTRTAPPTCMDTQGNHCATFPTGPQATKHGATAVQRGQLCATVICLLPVCGQLLMMVQMMP